MATANASYSRHRKSGPQTQAEMISDDDGSGRELTVVVGMAEERSCKISDSVPQILFPGFNRSWQSARILWEGRTPNYLWQIVNKNRRFIFSSFDAIIIIMILWY